MQTFSFSETWTGFLGLSNNRVYFTKVMTLKHFTEPSLAEGFLKQLALF